MHARGILLTGLFLAISAAACQVPVGLVSAPLGSGQARTAGIALGDVDGDGDLDVVVADGRHWPEQNWVLLNNGTGHFNTVRRLGRELNTSYAVPLGDLDGVCNRTSRR